MGTRTVGEASFARLLVAATLFIISSWSLSYSVYPAFNALDTSARYVSTLAGGVALLVVVAVAFKTPRLLDFGVIGTTSTALLVLGGLGAYFALASENAALLMVSSCCLVLAHNVVEVLVGVSIASLRRELVIPCVTLAYAIGAVAQCLLLLLPARLAAACFVAFPLISLSLIARDLEGTFERLKASVPPSDLSITQPGTSVPFVHQMFVCIFLFMFAYGYALGLGELEGGLPRTLNLLAAVPLLVALAVVALCLPQRFNIDRIFDIAVFCVIAGFVLIAHSEALPDGLANMFISVGSIAFRLLFWCAFALIAHDDRHKGVIAFAWGRALLAFGIDLGTFLGRSYNGMVVENALRADFITGLIAVLFVAYAVFVLKGFSMARTIESLDVAPLAEPMIDAGSITDEKCALVGRRYGLTSREVEVLGLVARGRNAPFIEEHLVISRNTVKSHVKNVYRKLGVHTNQELIDLVSQARADAPGPGA